LVSMVSWVTVADADNRLLVASFNEN